MRKKQLAKKETLQAMGKGAIIKVNQQRENFEISRKGSTYLVPFKILLELLNCNLIKEHKENYVLTPKWKL